MAVISELTGGLHILREAPKSRIVGSEYLNGKEIPEFSPYDVTKLEFEGCDYIYTLSGRPIKEIASNHIYKQKIWALNEKSLEYDASVGPIQVAINSRKLILPNSDDKSASEQEKLILKYSGRVGIPGTKSMMLKASHVFELFLQHWKETGEHLLGKEQNYKFARTSSVTGDETSVSVGCFHENLGLRTRSDPNNYKNKEIVALRVLVPAKKITIASLPYSNVPSRS